mmetsp:Transcript_7847/g.9006  ORF Transcript_7847/g.9006 Transcript_7847/m.9006 type:complete len:477 (-) Transcript_7847:191-1621(-)
MQENATKMLEAKNPNEMVRKHRMKRRLLRNLTQAWKRKEDMSEEEGGTTESDDSESESLRRQERRLSLKKEMFTTKRSVDQSSEGSFLRRAKRDIYFSNRLLPPTPSEMEEEADEYDFSRHPKRQDSNSTTKSNQTYDSMCTNLAKCTYHTTVQNSTSQAVIGELTRFCSTEDPHIFFDDDNTEADSVSVNRRLIIRRNLKVRFADECGRELESVYWTLTLYSEEENDWLRAIILLLSPRKKMFEFLHVSYNICDKTSISDVLEQLGGIATDEALKEQSYVGLLRNEGGRELINSVSIQSYYLSKDEMLIAVVEGYHGSSMMRMAKPIMENKRIMKAVKKAKSKKVSVKRLRSLPKKNSKRKISKKLSNDKKSESQKIKLFPVSSSSSSDTQRSAEESEMGPCQIQRSGSFSSDGSCGSVPEIDMDMDLDIMDTSAANAYFENDSNKDKIAITRFLNAGILSAVVCGVQKRFLGKR